MSKMTVKDVAEGKADLTEVRFSIVKVMLDNDPHLVKRVKAYLAWYHYTPMVHTE